MNTHTQTHTHTHTHTRIHTHVSFHINLKCDPSIITKYKTAVSQILKHGNFHHTTKIFDKTSFLLRSNLGIDVQVNSFCLTFMDLSVVYILAMPLASLSRKGLLKVSSAKKNKLHGWSA